MSETQIITDAEFNHARMEAQAAMAALTQDIRQSGISNHYNECARGDVLLSLEEKFDLATDKLHAYKDIVEQAIDQLRHEDGQSPFLEAMLPMAAGANWRDPDAPIAGEIQFLENYIESKQERFEQTEACAAPVIGTPA